MIISVGAEGLGPKPTSLSKAFREGRLEENIPNVIKGPHKESATDYITFRGRCSGSHTALGRWRLEAQKNSLSHTGSLRAA